LPAFRRLLQVKPGIQILASVIGMIGEGDLHRSRL
jgi:hypothetical protein